MAGASAAAKTTYEAYLAALSQGDGDINTDLALVQKYLTKRALADVRDGLEEGRSLGIKSVGPSVLKSFRLQQNNPAAGTLKAYACVDLSKVRVLDRAGKDVTPRSRPDRQTGLVSFKQVAGAMLVDKEATWSGPSIC